MIRHVNISDAGAISDIYNYYIENTTITFEEILTSPQEIKNRITNIHGNFPWLVHEDAGQVLGYAYAAQWRARSAYRYSAETTIYLDRTAVGKRLGSRS
jgi:phosphinothricin acetyltransferase